jgi:RND family efflux transporter MFP subunit
MLEKFKKNKIVFALWALMIVAGISYGAYVWSNNKKEVVQPQTATVDEATLTQTVSASGQIATTGQVPVTTQASGRVSTLYVAPGQKLKKGDKIMDIDPDSATTEKRAAAWTNYLSALNDLNKAKATLSTLEAAKIAAEKKLNDDIDDNLGPNNSTYAQDKALLMAAQAEYNNQNGVIAQAQATVNSAYVTYSETSSTVTATADGTIADIAYKEGSYIVAAESSSGSGSVGGQSGGSTTVATLKTSDTLIASLNVSELDVATVHNGQKVTLTLPAVGSKTYHGKVTSIASTGTTAANVITFTVTVEITDGGPEILAGMTVNGDITTRIKKSALTLPNSAIKTENGKHMATLLKDGQQRVVPITLGLVLDTQSEVTSGLEEGDTVIIPSSTSAATADGPVSSGSRR